MLQTLTSTQPNLYEDRGQALDPARFIDMGKRRIFYFAVPFVLVLILGFLIIAIQRPIYRSEGEVLVELPEIPTNLVAPTVTAAATERIQVIQQRLMSRDSLLPIVTKFNLFASEREWMSGTQLLDLMRDRSEIALVDLDTQISGKSKDSKPVQVRQNKDTAVAFTVSFEYENPALAASVANELLTSILKQDVEARNNHAAETTEFLAQEVKRLQDKLDAINGNIFSSKQQAVDPTQNNQQVPEQLKLQMNELTAMKSDLIQKSSVYSDEHPAVKALKKRIAALEHDIAQAPKTDSATPPKPEQDIDSLTQQQSATETALDDVSKRLTAARLGESMERNQQSEHLQVIEQPVQPQSPVRPNVLKLSAISFALAIVAGIGVAVLAEMLDKRIYGTWQLAGVIDKRLLVSIPYIPIASEIARKRRKTISLWTSLVVLLVVGIVAAIYVGIEVDFSGLDRSWVYFLTRLSK